MEHLSNLSIGLIFLAISVFITLIGVRAIVKEKKHSINTHFYDNGIILISIILIILSSICTIFAIEIIVG